LQVPSSDALVFFFQLLSLAIFIFLPISEAFLCHVVANLSTIDLISDHQKSWGYKDGPSKGPGAPPLLVAADSAIRIWKSELKT
jgi:hypothetical protein